MKLAIISTLSLVALSSFGQGTFVFDQQDSTSEGSPPYGSFSSMQSAIPPWGQSFTPALASTDFIRLLFTDNNTADGLGASVYLTLHSGAIEGPTIGTSESVTMANGFTGPATFLFPASVPLTPGTMYYFQPILQDGGLWNIVGGSFPYAGGNSYESGVVHPGNLWFREGVVVPEPSSAALLILGGCTFLWFKGKKS